jgi:hypothetical protein
MLKSIFAFLLTITISNALPNYVCTTSSEIDYYSNNIKDQFNFPSDWKQISTNNTCTYECEPCFPYAINNKIYNIGYHLKCGNVDNMIKETDNYVAEKLPLNQLLPANLHCKTGIFTAHNKYTLCIQDQSKMLINKVVIPALKQALVAAQQAGNPTLKPTIVPTITPVKPAKHTLSIKQQIIDRIKARMTRNISPRERKIEKFYANFYKLHYKYLSLVRKYNNKLKDDPTDKERERLLKQKKKAMYKLLKLRKEYDFIHQSIRKLNKTDGLYYYFDSK